MSDHLPDCPAASGEVLPCVCSEQPHWIDGQIMGPDGSGSISYADHVAAIEEALNDSHDPEGVIYRRGVNNGIGAARDAVEAANGVCDCPRIKGEDHSKHCPAGIALDAIDALQPRDEGRRSG